MNPNYLRNGKEHILYDADVADQVDGSFFEPAAWQRRNALIGTAQGRGTAAFVAGEREQYVLRHYRRGGMAVRLSDECYLWTGLQRSRPWREWHLLAELHGSLPVPRPVAVRLVRHGLCYSADIVTVRIDGLSLAQLLARGPVSVGLWQAVGGCVRRFHDAGVYHADLNAHNIVVDRQEQVYLVDFDRGRFRARGEWRPSTLERLRRSLRKLGSMDVGFAYSESDWDHLMAGYR